MVRRKDSPNQLAFRFRRKKERRGRPKKEGRDARVPHRERKQFVRRSVVGITLRLRDGLPRLRNRRYRAVLRHVFAAACSRLPGFSICQFSVQGNHLHMVCEADNHLALTRGMQGFAIRAAKAINKAAHRKGPVFVERYHVTYVKQPGHLRSLLLYVLNNHRRHGSRAKGADPYSSARWFDGWARPHRLDPVGDSEPPVAPATTALLTNDWRWSRKGLLDPDEVPPAALR